MKKNSFIRTIRPIDAQSVLNAPWVAVKSASKLTGLGEKEIRRHGTRRFGKTDFVNVELLNRLISTGTDNEMSCSRLRDRSDETSTLNIHERRGV